MIVMRFPFHTLWVTCLVLAVPAHGQVLDTIDELKACARTEDKGIRTACYEALGQRVLAAEDDNTDSTATETVTDAKLPDALGGDSFAEKAGEAAASDRGRVVSCKKASDEKWFYYFDNGQVWKQVDGRRRRHKACDFYVTISRDGFGYKMRIDGSNVKIRVNRRR